MRERTTIWLTIAASLVVIAIPLVVSLALARHESLQRQYDIANSLALDLLRRSDRSTDQTRAIFANLRAESPANPCSEQSITRMGRLDLASEQVQAVGYVRDNVLLCSSLGHHHTTLPPPSYRTSYGLEVRPSVEFPVLPGTRFLVVSDAASGYTVAILPRLPLDISQSEPDIALGVYSFESGRPIVSRGGFSPMWIAAVNGQRRARFDDGHHIGVAIRSASYASAAYVALPRSRLDAEFNRTAVLLVPVALVAGLVLAIAVLLVARRQRALPAMLRAALRRNELFMHYQPIMDLLTGRCVGAEALIRWRRDNGEMVRPDTFIPVAEQVGLIHEITRRVLDLVGQDAADIFRHHPDFHLAINLSADDMCAADTPGLVATLMTRTRASVGNLVMEVTERGFMVPDRVAPIINELRVMGIHVAIDDFGTGYSSLASLQCMALDYLKIDKSFVDTLGTPAVTSQVVTHIINMARSLGLEMVAEGIESEAQASLLRQQGVRYGQGYLFGMPVPFSELMATASRTEERAAGGE